jgi:hypothetical protein
VPKSDAELVSGALAVDYELGALVDCYGRFMAAEDTRDRIAANAFLEAMLVHARCLIEFIGKPPDERHIRRHDYLPEWGLSSQADRDEARSLFEEISKHLAHLSWDRAREAPPATWRYELPHFVVELFEEFVAEAGTARPGAPWVPVFEESVRSARTRLPAVPPPGEATTSGASKAVNAWEPFPRGRDRY